MKVTIDCDSDEIELSDDFTDNGFVQLTILSKEEVAARCTTVHPKELMKALQAFL